jgi:DNA mismatch repair protein MutL
VSKVKRLPDDLANKIAAGEVVERPASVVKELVENALDAGATRVRVEADQGGLARIVVSDDGDGMTREDALLSLLRHATSKIRVFEDLSHLVSFGFRGEALPSIASVSHLVMYTRPRHKAEGVRVTAPAGGAEEGQAAPAGCAPGTTIEVSELFYNVPARRKFLKSTATEAAHISEVLLSAALTRPEVTFELHRDGRVARMFPRAETRAQRASEVLGGEDLIGVRASRGDVTIEAFVSRPERSRVGAASLHFVVNGRVVRDRALARAVAQAYGPLLEPGRYPLGAVYIDMPPEQVDVNVHPQKTEVRFENGRSLYDLLARELGGQLSKVLVIPARGFSPFHSAPAVPTVATTTQKSAALESARDLALRAASGLTTAPAGPGWGASNTAGAASVLAAAGTSMAVGASMAAGASESQTTDLLPGEDFYRSLRFLGQAGGTYLVCEGSDGLYVLDQHAAAERVTFDRLRTAYAKKGVPMQRLLVPESLTVNAEEAELVESSESQILALGVELHRTGPQTVTVSGVPRILRSSPERIARDLLAELSHASASAFSGAVDLVLATMACHGSVRAGDTLAHEEVQALLESLCGIDFSGHCPHGRPVIFRMSFEELGRRVGR